VLSFLLYVPERAEKFSKAADASRAPHPDRDASLADALKKCAAMAVPQRGGYSE